MESQPPTPLRILCVDDHADTLALLKVCLSRSGHSVVVAKGYRAAMEAGRGGQFDLLITDIGLPDKEGLSLLAELRELYPISGIVLSGYGTAADILRTEQAGFRGPPYEAD